jgi:hypothetical protein
VKGKYLYKQCSLHKGLSLALACGSTSTRDSGEGGDASGEMHRDAGTAMALTAAQVSNPL